MIKKDRITHNTSQVLEDIKKKGKSWKEIKQKYRGKTRQRRLLIHQLTSNDASFELLVTTYQVTWYTLISECSYELPDYSVITHTTTIYIFTTVKTSNLIKNGKVRYILEHT
jgi:hypothetical protein